MAFRFQTAASVSIPSRFIQSCQTMKSSPLLAVLGTVLSLAISTAVKAAQTATPAPTAPPITQALWPAGKMPGKGPKAGAVEHAMPSRGDSVTRLTDITEPSISVFKPSQATKATPAVIICPGGAYGILAIDKEGSEIAAWLNSIGITGIVLKYRVPDNIDGAWQDAQRAIRLVRGNAGVWMIDPNRVGVIGFSAGGHLGARVCTNYDKSAYDPIDAALEAAQVPHEFFLLETGGHGYGLRSKGPVSEWPRKCEAWLAKLKIL